MVFLRLTASVKCHNTVTQTQQTTFMTLCLQCYGPSRPLTQSGQKETKHSTHQPRVDSSIVFLPSRIWHLPEAYSRRINALPETIGGNAVAESCISFIINRSVRDLTNVARIILGRPWSGIHAGFGILFCYECSIPSLGQQGHLWKQKFMRNTSHLVTPLSMIMQRVELWSILIQ